QPLGIENFRRERSGLDQDLAQGGSLLPAQVTEAPAAVPTRENLPQAPVDVRQGRRRQRGESLRIDQIAATVARQASPQVELPQRPPAPVERPPPLELGGEPRSRLDPPAQRRLAGEEKVRHHLLG